MNWVCGAISSKNGKSSWANVECKPFRAAERERLMSSPDCARKEERDILKKAVAYFAKELK